MRIKNDIITKNYKWVIVALCFLMIFFSLGFCSTSRTIFLSPITEALNIKRSVFSVSESFRFISACVTNMFFGTLVGRFGTKKLITAGFIFVISATLIFALANNAFLFYIGGLLFGIGFSWTSTSMVGCVIVRWCKKHTGTVMGFVLSANGIGGAVATTLYTPLIYNNGNPFGYKNAYFITAAILIAVLMLFLLLYKEKPLDSYENANKNPDTKTDWEGIEISKVKKMPCFYIAIICVFILCAVLESVYTVMAAYLKDVGFESSVITAIVSVNMLVLASSKVIHGAIYDRFGLRTNIIVCGTAAVASLVMFMMLNNTMLGIVLAVICVIILAIALPLQTIMLPLIAKELFGLKSYNHIVGILVSVAYAGFAVGIPLMNAVYDMFGSYIPGFAVACVLMLVATVIFQFVINGSNKYKKGETV